MIKKIIKKSKEDKGNSVIVLGILLIMATLLVGGMLLDISKAYQMKSSYIDSARKATQAAIRHQNSAGFLKAEAAAEAILVYENIARPSVIKDGYMTSCDDNRNVVITIYFMEDGFTRGSHVVTINSNQVNESDTVDDIMGKMKINGAVASNQRRAAIEARRYTGVEMELNETTPNVILPGATTIAGLDADDLKCQTIGVKAGASQFVGKTDGYN